MRNNFRLRKILFSDVSRLDSYREHQTLHTRQSQLCDSRRDSSEDLTRGHKHGAHISLPLLPPLGHGSTSAPIPQHLARNATPTTLHRRELFVWIIEDEEARRASAVAEEEAGI